MRRHLSQWTALSAVALLLVSGCAKTPAGGESAGTSGTKGVGRAYESPEAAIDAFVAALEKRDKTELAAILGPGTEGVLNSGDDVADSTAIAGFLERYRAKHQFVGGDEDHLVLQAGDDDWPMPFPIVRHDGKWYLDGAAGADEILMRRIGGNELQTIDVMNGYVEAQNEYASSAHDGVPAGTYAQKVRSDPGKQDGLYWEPAVGAAESPAGPALADAASEGYGAGAGRSAPYHGYYYRALKSQGATAPGGAAEYVVEGSPDGSRSRITTVYYLRDKGGHPFPLHVLQAGIEHRRTFVDAAADAGGDALNHVHQVRIVAELRIRFFNSAVAFDVHPMRAVDENIADRRILEQHFERPKAERLVEHFVDESFTLHPIEERVFRVAQAFDDQADLAPQGVAGQVADLREVKFVDQLAVNEPFKFFKALVA